MNRRNFLKGFLASATIIALAPLAPIVELSIQNATFESLVAKTLEAYRPMLVDNITRPSAVFLKMREFGWIPKDGMRLIA